MQALVRAPAPAPSVPAPPESPRQADEERNRERNRGYARAYRERKRLKLQTLENCRQELLKENARLLEEAQARDRKEAALSAERDAARDRLARVEAENRALRAWIHQLNAPPAQMARRPAPAPALRSAAPGPTGEQAAVFARADQEVRCDQAIPQAAIGARTEPLIPLAPEDSGLEYFLLLPWWKT